MTQGELLGFIIEHESVNSTDVSRRFGISITFAHQMLRRLEDKGLVIRYGGPYRYQFRLSDEAGKRLENLSKDKGRYGWFFLLGLAAGLLVGFTSSNKDKEEENGSKK